MVKVAKNFVSLYSKMKKIDRETVNRILDAADIVEVVSDFVTLKRRGANYIGLCPFHSERTPSFSVSKAKGICKCFSCGKGGSPVNFLMELEQMSYQEALRWLAKKYNIEIKEREESAEEKAEASLREAMFAVNQFAMEHFEHILRDTDDGRDIGLAYFRERGINDESIRRFHLGYALEKSDTLINDAVKHGFTVDNLVKTGLAAVSDRGPYDRFRGRVIYPVHSISGKVVAFGGRTLRTDKSIAKYVNSPESEIYSKSRELYGLYQARRSIVSKDRCILVEGYMDVISMSQSGVENVVASSGTSLTDGQVRLIHRFTKNVTVIYDADAAGIKASLRGVDMLLAEGLNVSVVLFPEGEDPDSFAQSHTCEELTDYLRDNETDFIRFKTKILLDDAAEDPIRRSHAIADILKSIAVIPDNISRQVYIEECSRRFGIDAKILSLEVAKGVAKIAEDAFIRKEREKSAATLETPVASPADRPPLDFNPLEPFERALVRYIVRYGMLKLCDAYDENNQVIPMTVMEYILCELNNDEIEFSDSLSVMLLKHTAELAESWPSYQEEIATKMEAERAKLKEDGMNRIRETATSLSEIQAAEADLNVNIEDEIARIETSSRRTYFERNLINHPDDLIRRLVTEFVDDRYQLSKVHSKFAHVETEEERLTELVPRAVYEYKDAILGRDIAELKKRISTAVTSDPERIDGLLTELMDKTRTKAEFAKFLGERIVTPNLMTPKR